jgi:hypothetical protein
MWRGEWPPKNQGELKMDVGSKDLHFKILNADVASYTRLYLYPWRVRILNFKIRAVSLFPPTWRVPYYNMLGICLCV